MTTAPDHIDDTPSPTDLQELVHLASKLFELLRTAKRELERDREAAKGRWPRCHLSCNRKSSAGRALGAPDPAHSVWQTARVRAFSHENLHRTVHAKDLSAVVQRSTLHFSRSLKQALGELPHAYLVRIWLRDNESTPKRA
jgi:hypothetical protein